MATITTTVTEATLDEKDLFRLRWMLGRALTFEAQFIGPEHRTGRRERVWDEIDQILALADDLGFGDALRRWHGHELNENPRPTPRIEPKCARDGCREK